MRDWDPPEVPTYHLFTQPTDKAVVAERSRPWGSDHFSFHDVLDIINPLQHIPIISTVYRYLTGDSIGAVPRIAGDTLYGGPVGFLAGLVGATLKQESGKDVGEQVIAMVGGDDSGGAGPGAKPGDAPAQIASGASAAAAPGVPASAILVPGSGPVGTAAVTGVPAATTETPAAPAAKPAATPAPAENTSQGGLPLAPRAATVADADPRTAFLARADALRRQYGVERGPVPNNRVVPLQGIGLPPGYGQPRPMPIAAPAMGPQATPTGEPASNASPGNPTATNGPPNATLADGAAANRLSAGMLPSNPPIDISQHMLDALDKYMRLQQRNPSSADDRGSQVNVTQ